LKQTHFILLKISNYFKTADGIFSASATGASAGLTTTASVFTGTAGNATAFVSTSAGATAARSLQWHVEHPENDNAKNTNAKAWQENFIKSPPFVNVKDL